MNRAEHELLEGFATHTLIWTCIRSSRDSMAQ